MVSVRMEKELGKTGQGNGIGEVLRDAESDKGWKKASADDVRFLRLETKKVRRKDGSLKTFERLKHDGVAIIVPVAGDGKLLMLRQYRPSVGAWLYELPAGMIEKGERPRDCAARELEEETGFSAGELKPMFSSYSSPGWSTEMHHFFLAQGLRKGKQHLDEDERLTVAAFTAGELKEMIKDGRIIDGKTIQGIYYYLNNLAAE